MLVAVDGACKRNGTPQCSSSGVAWIETEDGDYMYKAKFETESTSQRGEINGLYAALEYAAQHSTPEEEIIIITDSEYLHNTVTLGWLEKWYHNNWVGAVGAVKNQDLWKRIHELITQLNHPEERVFLQWTKGHLMRYTLRNTKAAMVEDPTGVELFMRITSIANRTSERQRIINDFAHERKEHDRFVPPDEIALAWVIANTTADSLATYVMDLMDNLVV